MSNGDSDYILFHGEMDKHNSVLFEGEMQTDMEIICNNLILGWAGLGLLVIHIRPVWMLSSM